MFCVVCCVLCVVSCSLSVVCCLLFVGWCLLCAVWWIRGKCIVGCGDGCGGKAVVVVALAVGVPVVVVRLTALRWRLWVVAAFRFPAKRNVSLLQKKSYGA